MATTDAIRQRSDRSPLTRSRGGAGAVRLGILWDYPFSLVRRLTLAFVALLAACFVGAYVLSQPADPVTILVHLVPVALAILISMYVAELVGVTERPLPPMTVESLFWAIATSCLVMAIGYAIVPTYAPSAALACSAPVLATAAVFLQRRWKEARGGGEEKVPALLFAGDRADVARGMAELADAPGVGVRAAVLPGADSDPTTMAGLPVDTPEGALERIRTEDIHLFLVARGARPEDLRPILAPCAGAGCIVERVDELIAKIQGRVALTAGDDIRLINRITTQATRFPAQRALDLVLGIGLTPPTLLLGIIVALLVKLTSKGPVLYRQKRVGRFGREFAIIKFRTMYVGAEKRTGPVWASENDPRITRMGRFLRRLRLDEMPQLLNVLKGDMSLVGPRPERRHFVDKLRRTIPLYDARHAVRPGVTGWAQIRYSYGADEEDARRKLGYELFYILNRSFTFYCAVLLETVKVLVFRRGAR